MSSVDRPALVQRGLLEAEDVGERELWVRPAVVSASWFGHYHWTAMGVLDAMGLLLGLVIVVGVFALPIWALRRQNRLYPKDRDRIGRDPEAAQATRRFETMWTFFSGRSGGM